MEMLESHQQYQQQQQQQTGIQMPTPVSYTGLQESSRLKTLSPARGEADGCGDGGGGGNDIAIADQESKRQAERSGSSAAARKAVQYRECLKNYAAAIGGNAVDGCGEFMPSGEEGTLEALKCAACGCHRNFHRREVEGEEPCYCFGAGSMKDRKRLAATLALPPHHPAAQLALPSSPLMSHPPPHMIMELSCGPASESEEQDGMAMAMAIPHTALTMHSHPGMAMPMMKKRFRTKFTSEQKNQMCAFAEKLGWRIQKQDEAMVQQFCMEVGVKRHVLKVWMHNNKNTLGKKMLVENYDPDPNKSIHLHGYSPQPPSSMT